MVEPPGNTAPTLLPGALHRSRGPQLARRLAKEPRASARAAPRSRKPAGVDGPDARTTFCLDWSELYDRARAALVAQFAQRPELAPYQAAQTVALALPRPLRRWFLRALRATGWVRSRSGPAFDVLDGPGCPPALRGAARELVRLAVFGLPGQGLASRDKHRQDVYQQLCAEIMRTAVDLVSLEHIATRVMRHPDVAGDSVLHSMLRGFIAERQAALRPAPTTHSSASGHDSQLRSAFVTPLQQRFPTRDEVLDSFSRLQREFEGCLAQYEERRALAALDKLRDLRRRFPEHAPAGDLQRAEEQYDRLLKRSGTYRRQIRDLAAQGAAAARAGDQKTATWVLRRLEAIHALLPNLLPDADLGKLRGEIHRSAQEHDMLVTVRELNDKKREVARKIKNLAGAVHRFHQLAARLPPQDEAYRRAEANYRQAVEEIRGMNTEWLSGLVVQLETLMADLEDPDGKMHSELDHFIALVRTALNRLCLEIRARQRTKGSGPSPTPPSQSAGTSTPPPA